MNKLWPVAVGVDPHYKSTTVCKSLYSNKGQMNKSPLRWHVNWQTNCLICVGLVKGAQRRGGRGGGSPPLIYIWLEFNGLWVLYCPVATVTNLFSRFPTDQNVLFCPLEMCHASQMGPGPVCINLFLLPGRNSPAMNIWTIEFPAQWAQLMRSPRRPAGTKDRNDDIWSQPAQGRTPIRPTALMDQTLPSDVCPCLLISW